MLLYVPAALVLPEATVKLPCVGAHAIPLNVCEAAAVAIKVPTVVMSEPLLVMFAL